MTSTAFKHPRVRTRLTLFLSLTVALVVTMGHAAGSGGFFDFMGLIITLNYRIGLETMNPVGGYLAVCLCILSITVVLFTFFRFLRGTSIDRAILSFGGALVAVAAAPIGFFWITHWYNWYPLEVAIYLCLAILYLSTGPKIPLAVVVPVAAFHYLFWLSLYWCCVGQEPVRQSVPFLGFCMALAWIHYVRAFKSAV